MKSRTTLLAITAAMFISTGVTVAAPITWTVTNLHPSGQARSYVYAIDGTKQAGNAFNSASASHAMHWSGTAASFVDMQPAAFTQSDVWDADAGQQVGWVGSGGGFGLTTSASLWTGTAASYVNLAPAGSAISAAYGVHAGKQVGVVTTSDFFSHAALWTGTAASYVDLTPPGIGDATLYGIDAAQEVGYTSNGPRHASVWNGVSTSFVDLHPAGATESEAWGVDHGKQVGRAIFTGVNHASLWSGTAASWIDLSPAGSTDSYAFRIFDGKEVGYATFGGINHAALWSGTAASFEDLSLALPGSWGHTEARAIWHDSTKWYIGGDGINNATGRTEALLWTQPLPEPSALAGAAVLLAFITRRTR